MFAGTKSEPFGPNTTRYTSRTLRKLYIYPSSLYLQCILLKRRIERLLCPNFTGAGSDLTTGHAPCLLVQKTSHLGLTAEDMLIGCQGNYLYIYLEYAYSIVYIQRKYRAHYAQFSMCSSQPVDPGRMIGTVRRARWSKKQAT